MSRKKKPSAPNYILFEYVGNSQKYLPEKKIYRNKLKVYENKQPMTVNAAHMINIKRADDVLALLPDIQLRSNDSRDNGPSVGSIPSSHGNCSTLIFRSNTFCGVSAALII